MRQIEAKIIREMQELLSGTRIPKDWSFDKLLVSNFNLFKSRLKTLDPLVLKPELDGIIQQSFGGPVAPPYLNLFMELAGYIRIPNRYPSFRGSIENCWHKSSTYSSSQLEAVLQALELCFKNPKEIPIFDLIVAAKKKNRTISNDAIQAALKACTEIETIGENARLRFSFLRSAADKAYRILESQSKPLHYSEIAKEINLSNKSIKNYKVLQETNLTNQLAADPRFINIGKSGEWALKEWDSHQNITILEALEAILHQEGEPLSFERLKEAIKASRPDASIRSIRVYLNDRPDRITRTPENLYGLSAWKLASRHKSAKPQKTDLEMFHNAAIDFIKRSEITTLPELLKYLSAKLTISEVTVRQIILRSGAFQLEQATGKNYKLVKLSDQPFDIQTDSKEKALLRDRIASEIRSILHSNPNKPFTKGQLFEGVCKTLECKRPTFYATLSKLSEFRQYKAENDHLVIYEHTEKTAKIEINLSSFDISPGASEKISRAVSKLTPDEVDIALFELGVIFENEIKSYLLRQKELGKLTVTAKDTSRLVDMINWVVDNKKITKGHHLNTLREERNNRAHGELLNAEERQELFNKAYYVAELFIRYICLFDNLKRELG
ncbi:hypothetical protein [Stutzerimonas chloritidismutans]|uniref:hypothetical protein n=1 Tax=Stutzerimonas chloritidismutans TaxID=203192 RepID=UPI00384E6E32